MFLCTGTLVSAHVVLTAAHCLPAGVSAKVFGGPDISQATPDTLLAVTSVQTHPLFDAGNPEAGYDVGAVVLAQAFAGGSAQPMNHGALTPAEVGGTLRIIGYGVDDGTTQKGGGLRRQGTVSLDGYSPLLVSLGDATHGTCNGDSGGPAFLTIGGKSQIIGVTSFGPEPCNGVSSDTRLDAVVGFVDDIIAGVDPPPVVPDAGSTAGQTPPGDIGAPERDQGGCAVGGRPGDAGTFVFVVLLAAALRRRRE